MGAYSSSKTIYSLCKAMYLIFLVVLLFSSCSATRLGKIGSLMVVRKEGSIKYEHMKIQHGKYQLGFRYKGQIFNYFPKGKPVPPSGPSKRHNSAPEN